MTEQLMSVPAISKVPAGSVSGESRDEEIGPPPAGATGSAERGGSIWMVLLVAVALIAALGAIMMLGGSNAELYTFGFLTVLASVGVFSLFAFACGILRVRASDRGNPLIKAVVDGAPEAVVVTANDGPVVYGNPAYLGLIEASDAKELRPVERAFIGDADASEAIYRLLRAAREGRQLEEEVRVTGMKDRPARWLRFRIRPLGGDKRGARLTVWSIADVTRERERQENVFQELQHAIDYLDHAPAGFFSVAHNGDVVYLNATLANWLGHDLAEVGSGGLKLGELVAGDGAALLTTLPATPGEVKTEVLDLDLRTRSGGTVPVRVLHKIAYGADGTPGASRTLVLNRARDDRSDPQRAAEIRFVRFFHHTPMAIATIDKHGGVVRTNPLFARLFHSASSVEAKERSIVATVAPRDREALQSAIWQAALGKTDIAPVDAMLAGDGERFGRFYVTAVEEEDRDQESAIVYALETTAQRELENKVAQQQKMELVGQLAGGIAHDFNNVLSAIMMATDFLLNAHKPTDPSFGDIMQIKQNANRAASLVRHLLAFSRKQTLRPQVLDIGEALSDLTMLLRRLIGEKVALDVVHGRDLWPVKVDISQFEQVIVNLAVNARDAMPNGGRLTVRTSNVTAQESVLFNAKGMPAADYVLVEVADTGFGIPANIIGKIFEPFFSTKEVGKGTGLGLSTVYGIIKQTGGFVYVDSVEHKGTVFRIFLPRHAASAQDVAAERDEAAAGALADRKSPDSVDLTGQGTILLVEDEEGLRQLNARGLASRGYTVLEAGNGIEAIEMLENSDSEVDLVVSDVVMPEMDGPTLLRELRRRNPNLKIIFVSGYAEDAFQKHMPTDGERPAFLPKPFTLKQLVNAVKETLAA